MWQLWDHALGVGLPPAERDAELERGGCVADGGGGMAGPGGGSWGAAATAGLLFASSGLGAVLGS